MTHHAEGLVRSRRVQQRGACSPVIAVALAASLALAASDVGAQQIFHSTQSANLATTETLGAGNLMFEISHRFLPALSQGADQLWGFDGPVYNRLALTYGATDRIVLGVMRTNLQDNLELNARGTFFEQEVGTSRVELGVMGGVAWNTEVVPFEGAEDNESQLYVQVIANARLGENFAVGLVPTYLRNPRLRDVEADDHLALGIHAQAYLSDAVSLLGEWIVSEEVAERPNDSATFGIEFETRGHFFKIIVTNQVLMNPTQFLAGSQRELAFDELRVGFNITRLLPF